MNEHQKHEGPSNGSRSHPILAWWHSLHRLCCRAARSKSLLVEFSLQVGLQKRVITEASCAGAHSHFVEVPPCDESLVASQHLELGLVVAVAGCKPTVRNRPLAEY